MLATYTLIAALVAVVLPVLAQTNTPFWKVTCNAPIFQGRVDPIVSPGVLSSHVHKVFGGSAFSASEPTRLPSEQYNVTASAACTTCSLNSIDNSNYWSPSLYYQHLNGSFSLVPHSGLTVYYLSRTGTTGANKTNPNWQPLPKGLRMLAGSSSRRSFDSTDIAQNAVSYVCLVKNGAAPAQSPGFQTKDNFCGNGMRAQIWFPMCWDGINFDSSDGSHMSYPVGTDNPQGGDCPNAYPVRVPGIFIEHFFDVSAFPHGDGTRQPFVWANGDSTGYGYHADVISGWDTDVMAKAIADPTCRNQGDASQCVNSLSEYVKSSSQLGVQCPIAKTIPLTEALGVTVPLARLPGCNPVTAGPAPAAACSSPPSASDNSGVFFVQSVWNGLYLTADYAAYEIITASVHPANAVSRQLWSYDTALANSAGYFPIQHQDTAGYLSAQSTLELISVTPQQWELWKPVKSGNSTAFLSARTGHYLTINTDGTFAYTSTTIVPAALFNLVQPDGGHVNAKDGYNSVVAAMAATNTCTS